MSAPHSSISLTITLPSREFCAIVVAFRDSAGRKAEVWAHPLVLAANSKYFEKVAFDGLPGAEGEGAAAALEIPAPNAYAAVDLVNSFYGQKTNTGGCPRWEAALNFAYAKSFFCASPLEVADFVAVIPKSLPDFAEYFAHVADFVRRAQDEKQAAEAFFAAFAAKVGDFFEYFGESATLAAAEIGRSGLRSDEYLGEVIRTMPLGCAEAVEAVLLLAGKAKLTEKQTEVLGYKTCTIRAAMDPTLAEKYLAAAHEPPAEVKPTKIAGIVSGQYILVFDLAGELPPRFAGYHPKPSSLYVTTKGTLTYWNDRNEHVKVGDGDKETIVPLQRRPIKCYDGKPYSLVAFKLLREGEFFEILDERDPRDPMVSPFGSFYKTLPFSIRNFTTGKSFVVRNNVRELYFSACEGYIIWDNPGESVVCKRLKTDTDTKISGGLLCVAELLPVYAHVYAGRILVQRFADVGVNPSSPLMSVPIPGKIQRGAFSTCGDYLALTLPGKILVYGVPSGDIVFYREVELSDVKFF